MQPLNSFRVGHEIRTRPITKTIDDKNILDAQGIRKITELTAAQHVHTNLFQNDEMKKIKNGVDLWKIVDPCPEEW